MMPLHVSSQYVTAPRPCPTKRVISSLSRSLGLNYRAQVVVLRNWVHSTALISHARGCRTRFFDDAQDDAGRWKEKADGVIPPAASHRPCILHYSSNRPRPRKLAQLAHLPGSPCPSLARCPRQHSAGRLHLDAPNQRRPCLLSAKVTPRQLPSRHESTAPSTSPCPLRPAAHRRRHPQGSWTMLATADRPHSGTFAHAPCQQIAGRVWLEPARPSTRCRPPQKRRPASRRARRPSAMSLVAMRPETLPSATRHLI